MTNRCAGSGDKVLRETAPGSGRGVCTRCGRNVRIIRASGTLADHFTTGKEIR